MTAGPPQSYAECIENLKKGLEGENINWNKIRSGTKTLLCVLGPNYACPALSKNCT